MNLSPRKTWYWRYVMSDILTTLDRLAQAGRFGRGSDRENNGGGGAACNAADRTPTPVDGSKRGSQILSGDDGAEKKP
ncbi:hypothetical protein LWI28_012889 [Acer negundo]|uniref:Uncharacterized protein n=1 Tax=Acer negundo TaxID=4023 RepID=A0AAD5IZ48_ACENE|nr:hypothetical protein LWI28_012889 [Acer negundo]